MSTSLFEQAFAEVAHDAETIDAANPRYRRWGVLERLREPDRVLRFTVRWIRDDGIAQHTPAWRVQYCNAIGPYKGGLRFSPHVNEDTLLFLGFEQCLKNALTGLPLGGGKGGARFSPGAHSEAEVMRFCQAFMDEYVRYAGEDTDVPAGDIGTGAREIGFLFGRFVKLTGRHVGAFTGKPEAIGGIPGRTEATGYGCVEFARLMLEQHGAGFQGATVIVSGAGNVAIHAAEHAIGFGARVVALSNSKGVARFDEGLTLEQLEEIKAARSNGQRIETMDANASWLRFDEGAKPWSKPCDIALPCATQNELDADDAALLIKGGVKAVVEGANMPCTGEAISAFRDAGTLVGPGKAANAGGVAVSGFEMSQNASRDPWTRDRVLTRLTETMGNIHAQCVEHGQQNRRVDYIRGANTAAYHRLAEAIIAMGPT